MKRQTLRKRTADDPFMIQKYVESDDKLKDRNELRAKLLRCRQGTLAGWQAKVRESPMDEYRTGITVD